METLEELEARHRKELKELTAHITGLKKTATKGDKKKKKEVQAEIALLEASLRDRHQKELNELQARTENQQISKTENEDSVVDTVKQLNSMNLQEDKDGTIEEQFDQQPQAVKKKKPNRQQLRKERKAAKLVEMREQAEKEASGQVNMQEIENSAIRDLLAVMSLELKEITPDGHCLYNAISDQLKTRHATSVSYKELRQKAAEYLREHPDDFIPFLYNSNGDMYTSEDFVKYCNEIENTASWGGQLEILALSKAYQVPIHVVQMGSPMVKIGEEEFPDKAPLLLSYHRHAYGLGEHYNSLHGTKK
ncbi:uncharacterized protein VTP21DRAFT_6479 [Calcarisporiella thermophila]|uniref:uncharacterized protein n=1 Tax=Calcarisporiella thermophila TaxID=911321 RepID=UPI003743EBE1